MQNTNLNIRKEVFGWCMYDWANSAFATTVMAGFFPVFFNKFWSVGVDTTMSTARLGFANSIAGIIVALAGPVLGAIADRGSSKKRFLLGFTFMGIVASLALYVVHRGDWMNAVLLYVLGVVGFSGGIVFYDSLITNVASESKRNFVSALGYAAGYLGGGILFAINVWMTLRPVHFGLSDSAEAVRISFLSVGIWWAIFSVPIFIFVNEKPKAGQKSGMSIVREGIEQLIGTFREIRRLRNIFLFLVAYWLYIDGVDTIIRMAVDYGISIGLESKDLITALIITQFIGFPSTIGFGYLGNRIGAKKAIFIAIAVYLIITVLGAFMRSAFEFYMLAMVVGLVQGGVQALSRSFYSTIIPVDKSAEYFGFYNMVGKFAVVLGPVLMGGVGLLIKTMGFSSDIATRVSILSIAVLLMAGGILFYFVDENKAKKEAGYQH